MANPWDRIKTTHSSAMLRQLTNPDAPGTSSITDSVGTQACDFAKEEFAMVVGVTYDDSIVSHQFAIDELVIYILQLWANKLGESASKREEAVYGRLKRLAQTRGGRNRITPTTSSPDVPTDDSRGGAISEPLPDFDLTKFDKVTPNDPQGSGAGDFPSPFPL